MIVYGKQVFFYILERHKELINELYLAKECDKKSLKQILNSGFKIKKLDFKTAQAYSRGGNHQGFLLNIKDYEFKNLNTLKQAHFIAILYGISDVGNIGSIARTAHALGADGLIFIGQRLKIEPIIRTSSAAVLDLDLVLNNEIFTVLNELKQVGFQLFASSSKARCIHKLKIDRSKKKALILGSEGLGLSKKIIQKCDECVGIKMKNNFDSLNVSAAFAILCDRMVNA